MRNGGDARHKFKALQERKTKSIIYKVHVINTALYYGCRAQVVSSIYFSLSLKKNSNYLYYKLHNTSSTWICINVHAKKWRAFASWCANRTLVGVLGLSFRYAIGRNLSNVCVLVSQCSKNFFSVARRIRVSACLPVAAVFLFRNILPRFCRIAPVHFVR